MTHEDVNPSTVEVEDKHFWLVFGSGLAPWVKPHPLPCQSRSEHLKTHLSTSIESAAAIPIRSRTEAQYRHTFRSPLTRSSAKLGYERRHCRQIGSIQRMVSFGLSRLSRSTTRSSICILKM